MKKKLLDPPKPMICAWRTGIKHCRMRPSGRYCSWHSYWFKLVDRGDLARQQREEFFVWWEQFQPYGMYAHAHGSWWADKDLLWLVLAGESDQPVKTIAIEHELEMRRAEVQGYKYGLYHQANQWPRVTGLPLPGWQDEEWQKKVNAQVMRASSI